VVKIKIGGRLIGEGERSFIIAEAGVNHNGDIGLAKKLIDAAKEAGADAVKFQTFKAEEVAAPEAEKADYQKQTTGSEESQLEMIKNLELSEKDFEDLSLYARQKGIVFLSTAFDNESADLLEKLGVPAFKIPSGEINNFPFLKYIAGKGRPVILSTGMSTLKEVEEAVRVIRGEGIEEIVLLHCVSSYPASVEDTNLRAMDTMKQAFGLPVGLSDHSTGIIIPAAAVAMGACVIEKHFTLDRNLPGPDHLASLEPDELKEMVNAIQEVEKALGDGVKKPVSAEEEVKKVARRSVVAVKDIPEDTVITREMLAIKRPGTGIEPKKIDTVIGKETKRYIKSGELINFADLK
jgi:N,N'-diacetyllegionaminate synthase